jgi:N-acetyl-anhydromuramyl-L-alanine amidase AmpD
MAKNITSLALALCMTLPLIGCVATTEPRYVIDSDTYQATGKSERVKFIILHYTVGDN